MIRPWNEGSSKLVDIHDNLVELLTKINISCQGTVNPGPEIDIKNLEIYSKEFQNNIKSAIKIIREMLQVADNLSDEGIEFFTFILTQLKEFIEIVSLERKFANGTYICPFPPSKTAYNSLLAYKQIIEYELMKEIKFLVMLNQTPLGSTRGSIPSKRSSKKRGGKTKKKYKKKRTNKRKNKRHKTRRKLR